MATPSWHKRSGLLGIQQRLIPAYKYNWYIIERMLGSPLAKNESLSDVVTNERYKSEFTKNIGKTSGIDVKHFEGFWEVVGRELSIEIMNLPIPFISATGRPSHRLG